MNKADLQKLAEPPNPWRMFKAMGGIGVICSLLIVFTFQVTLPTIKHNKKVALERAVFKVLPGATSKVDFKITTDNRVEPLQGEAENERLVYAGYDEQDSLIGIALAAQGQGFQDVIRLLYGYSPQKQAITGIWILESKETPGLGDKIEKDAAFVANFETLDVSLQEDLQTLKNLIEFTKNGKKEHPWQIEGITGATISSKAITNILRKSAAELVPLLVNNLEQFKGK